MDPNVCLSSAQSAVTSEELDNKGAIDLVKTRQFSARMKHMDVRYHFLHWVCENGTIKLVYCPTEDMMADILTKPLPSFKVKHFANELGLRTI
ncbi:hypothetical protein ACEPAF_1666 [Sanghuangporus sanghuang]